jgi:hypothetical protein
MIKLIILMHNTCINFYLSLLNISKKLYNINNITNSNNIYNIYIILGQNKNLRTTNIQ